MIALWICAFVILETRIVKDLSIHMPAITGPFKTKKPEAPEEHKPYKPPSYIYATRNQTNREEKLAYVMFLSSTDYSGEDLEKDNYLVSNPGHKA